MSEDPITVRTTELRTNAEELTGTAYRLGHGLAGAPGLTVSAPGWAAAVALTAVEQAVHRWLTGLGGDVAALATGLRAAADGYDAADDRAARRLGGVR